MRDEILNTISAANDQDFERLGKELTDEVQAYEAKVLAKFGKSAYSVRAFHAARGSSVDATMAPSDVPESDDFTDPEYSALVFMEKRHQKYVPQNPA